MLNALQSVMHIPVPPAGQPRGGRDVSTPILPMFTPLLLLQFLPSCPAPEASHRVPRRLRVSPVANRELTWLALLMPHFDGWDPAYFPFPIGRLLLLFPIFLFSCFFPSTVLPLSLGSDQNPLWPPASPEHHLFLDLPPLSINRLLPVLRSCRRILVPSFLLTGYFGILRICSSSLAARPSWPFPRCVRTLSPSNCGRDRFLVLMGYF